MLVVFGLATNLFSQDKVKLYDPTLDGMKQIKEAVSKAKSQSKNVLIQYGGNWCSWCLRFHAMATGAHKVDSLIKADYVYLLINYSKENKNMEMMKQLEYPNRFGFPVFVILDGNGKRLHTQDSGLLEHNTVKGYDTTKVITFLKMWDVRAVDPSTYKDK